MSITRTFYAFCFALLSGSATAQESVSTKPYSPKNTVYLELGGIGYNYSLNYQRNFVLSKRFDIAAGVSVNPLRFMKDGYYDTYARFTPTGALTLQGIYEFGRNELALGGAYGYYTYYGYYCVNNEIVPKMEGATMAFASLGFSHTWGRHIYAGAYFWLHIASHGYTEFIPWGGLRIGYKFGK